MRNLLVPLWRDLDRRSMAAVMGLLRLAAAGCSRKTSERTTGNSSATSGAFFPAGPERELLERGDVRIEYTEYDWTLNSLENGRSDH